MTKKKNKVQICVVGWHFFSKFYKQISKTSLDIHIVAHRYNKILDDFNLKYSVVPNVGREFHAYDWYIKNVWDGKSAVIFTHDDVKMKNIDNIFNDLFSKLKGLDFSYILGEKDRKYKTCSERCMYFSPKLIKLLLKRYDGFWYDIHNKGYTFGTFSHYDPNIYTSKFKKYYDQEGREFKKTINALINKYKLKFKNVINRKILLYRRGGIMNGNTYKYILNDNSIFGREDDDNYLDKTSIKYKSNKCRIKHFYTKWYNFYFSSIKNDALNILEIGGVSNNSVKIWEEYFKNSNIYGTKNEDKIDSEFLQKVCESVPLGFDIIIDGSDDIKIKTTTFEFLFKAMNPGGIYVIENLQSYYKKQELEKDDNFIDFLKLKINDVNYNGKYKFNSFEKLVKNSEPLLEYERLISGISFHAGICFVFKRFCK
jgi:hypothetical protein